MFFRPVLLIAGAGLAVAQSLSSQCTSALLTVASSPETTCLDLTLLAPLATNSNTTSVIPTVNAWLAGMCNQGACSNATLQAVVTDIMAGCSSDLATLGLATNNTSGLVTTVQGAYPAVRQSVCLKDTSANTLCATELLTDVQSSTTTLSINNIIGLLNHTVSTAAINISQIACSNCSKAVYNIVSQDFPSLLTSELPVIQSVCGSSFTDGQMPSNIQETASNSTSSSSGATSLSVSSFNVGVAMLVAVFSAFVVLA